MERHMIRILNHLHGILPSTAIRANPVEMFNSPFKCLIDGKQTVSQIRINHGYSHEGILIYRTAKTFGNGDLGPPYPFRVNSSYDITWGEFRPVILVFP